MAQLIARSLPVPNDPGLNPFIGNFYLTYLLMNTKIHKKRPILKTINIDKASYGRFFLFFKACHSSDSHESNDPYFNATLVWTMQLQLMAIIAGTVGSVLTFPVQFNENAAWSVLKI